MKKLLLSTLLASLTFAAGILPIKNSLVVYNGGVGLVHETSTLYLTATDKEIVYRGVANSINTDSVNLSLPKDIQLFSQQYRYDKLSFHKLLDANINKTLYIKKKKVTLLSHSGNFALVKKSNGDIVQVDKNQLILKKIPNSFLTQPTLIWNVHTKKNIETDIELSYLINNISWHSNYVLSLEGTRASLSGYITIDNHSGKEYKETELFVVAGELQQSRQARPTTRYNKMMSMSVNTSVQQKAYGGYHLYQIPFKVTLRNNEKTQLKFINIKNIKLNKLYSVSLASPHNQQASMRHDVSQIIELKNIQEPLPQGILRSYSRLNNTNVLLGESSIKNTPKNTKISLKLGYDFDSSVDSTLQSSSITKQKYTTKIQYKVNNNSKNDKEFKLHIPFSNRNNSTLESSQKYTFINANLVEFSVVVKANSSYTFNATFIQKR